jgi:outer membrane lipoprotein-sorting protein
MKRLIGIVSLLTTFHVHGEDAASILAKSDVYRNPLSSFSIDVELTSFEKARNATSTSTFRVHGKGSDRSVVEFLAPASDKGKYLLMLRDAMWIYLPSASRPIRISPLQRLMGQASNGDVARTSFTVDYVATAAIAEGDAWIVDLEAKDLSIAYKRVRLWIDRVSYEPQRADFYVASGKLIKRAHYRQVGVLAGRRTITEIEIEDLLHAGNRTVMRYSNLVARENPDKMFTRDALGKW